MRIASLDPGTKSGLVFWEGELRRYSGSEVADGLAGAWEIDSGAWLNSAQAMAHMIVEYGAELVLYEDFILEGGSHSSDRSGLDPVRIACGVEALLRVGAPFVVVEPFSRNVKSVMTDERMKLWGLWLQGRKGFDGTGKVGAGSLVGCKGHATDAARGLVWYLRERIES